MVGITLSPEQVRAAPPEVRHWLEQQIAETLGFQRPTPAVETARHLVGCAPEALRAALGLIQHILPVASVFFELAREGQVMSQRGLRVLRVDDVMRHCRLQTPEQVVACLEAINRALQQASGDPEAVLTVVDNGGHVLEADMTARGIQAIWQEIVDSRRAATEQSPAVAPPPEAGSAQVGSAQVGSAQMASAPIGSPQPFQPYAISVPSASVQGDPARR